MKVEREKTAKYCGMEENNTQKNVIFYKKKLAL